MVVKHTSESRENEVKLDKRQLDTINQKATLRGTGAPRTPFRTLDVNNKEPLTQRAPSSVK